MSIVGPYQTYFQPINIAFYLYIINNAYLDFEIYIVTLI